MSIRCQFEYKMLRTWRCPFRCFWVVRFSRVKRKLRLAASKEQISLQWQPPCLSKSQMLGATAEMEIDIGQLGFRIGQFCALQANMEFIGVILIGTIVLDHEIITLILGYLFS